MSDFIHNFTEKTIQLLKKDSGYDLDKSISGKSLLQILSYRLCMVIRGGFRKPFLGQSSGVLFLGSNVTLRHPQFIKIGRGNILEDFVFIDALSTDGVNLGNNVKIAKHTTIECTGVIRNIGKGLIIGSNSAIGAYSYIGAQGGIKIGENVIMGPRVNFHSENHNYNDLNIPIRLQGESRKGIVVEDDCWVGAGSVFLDGSYVEKGCVIAAGSVVKAHFPPFSIIGGVPAKIIKSRGKIEPSNN